MGRYVAVQKSFFLFFFNFKINRVVYNFVGESKLPHILYVLDVVEFHTLAVHLRNLLDVLAVLLAHYDVGDAGTLCCKNLLLDATNRQNLTAERDFASHCCVLAHLALSECRGN